MNCPSCKKSLSTFLKFYLWSHPFNRTCKHCGVKLKPNNKIKQFLLIEFVTAMMILSLVNQNYGILTVQGLLIFLMASAVMCYPFEKFAWSKGYYTIK